MIEVKNISKQYKKEEIPFSKKTRGEIWKQKKIF